MKKSWVMYIVAAYVGALVVPRLPFKLPGV
jgi:hypothetical protein